MKLKQDIDFKRYGYPLAVVILVLLSLLYIEYKHPYFFLQDDNRDSYLPYFVHNYESMLNGEIALYNFHQFLGIPSLATGQAATLYPITYISVFLSDLIFDHYFATIEIEVILHLITGAVGFYRFLRYFGNEHNISLLGGLTWSLCSFVIYVSNSWVVVSAVAAYFPWMLYFSLCLYKNHSIKNIFYSVVVRLLLFFTGNVQYFIYSVIFEFLTVILYIISDSNKNFRKIEILKYLKIYSVSYLNVFVYSLPLLIPMWNLTSNSAQRSGRLPFGVFVSLFYPIEELIKDMIYPFSKLENHSVWLYGNVFGLSFIGYIPLLILIYGIIRKIKLRKTRIIINSVHLSVFIRPALLALMWSTNWAFNLLIYIIPILNRFRFPFKINLYFNFYIITIAMFLLSQIMKQYVVKERKKKVVFCIVIGIQLYSFLFLYTATEFKAFGYQSDMLPLEENLKHELNNGRIISLGFELWKPFQENNKGYITSPSIGFNYATLWGLYYFAGYDMFLSQANANATLGLNYSAFINSREDIPIDNLRKAAVCWYIIPKSKEAEFAELLEKFGLVKKFEDENRIVYYDGKAYPMVFNSELKKIDTEDYYVTTNTIQLTVELQQSDTIIFNNIFNSYFEGFIDGEKVEIKPINNVHFCIDVPKGKHNILIKYNDPYFKFGIYLSLIFFLIKMVCLKKSYSLK